MAQLSLGYKINMWPSCSKQRHIITVKLNPFLLQMGTVCFRVSSFSQTSNLRSVSIHIHGYGSWSLLRTFIPHHIECLRTKATDTLSIFKKGTYQLLRTNRDNIFFSESMRTQLYFIVWAGYVWCVSSGEVSKWYTPKDYIVTLVEGIMRP